MASQSTLNTWNPPNELDMFHALLFLGESGQGKSTIAKKVAYQLSRAGRIYAAMAFCGNREVMGDMEEFIHPSMVHFGFDEDRVKQVVDIGASLMGVHRQGGPARPILIILEDIAAMDDKILKCETLQSLLTQGRHNGVCVWVLAQNWRQIPSKARTAFSDLVLCHEASKKTRKDIYLQFGVGGMDEKDFQELFTRATRNYGTFVVRRRAPQGGGPLNSVRRYAVNPMEFPILKKKYFRLAKDPAVWANLYAHQSIETDDDVMQKLRLKLQRLEDRRNAIAAGTVPDMETKQTEGFNVADLEIQAQDNIFDEALPPPTGAAAAYPVSARTFANGGGGGSIIDLSVYETMRMV